MQSGGDLDGDDDISVTSTVESEPQEEYEVDCILAQKTFKEGEGYLVQWTGYPVERATWELAHNFMNPRTLEEWDEQKKAIARGERPSPNYEAMVARVDAFNAARDNRKARRRAKRIRLGLPVSPSESSSQESFLTDSGSSDDDDNEPDRRQSKQRGRDSGKPSGLQKVSPNKASPHHDASSEAICKQSSVSQKISQTRPSINVQSSKATSTKQKPERPKLSLQIQRSPAKSSIAAKSASATSDKSFTKRTVPSETGPTPKNRGRKPGQDLGSILRQKQRNTTTANSNENSRLFRNLSTQNRYAKAARREVAPNVNQLDLRKPEDWAKPSAPIGPASNWSERRDIDSLFVEQDSPPRPSTGDKIGSDNQTPTSANAERSAPAASAYQNAWSQDSPSRRSSLGLPRSATGPSEDSLFTPDSYRESASNQSPVSFRGRYDSYQGSGIVPLARQSSGTWKAQQSSDNPSGTNQQYRASGSSPQHSPKSQSLLKAPAGPSKSQFKPDNRTTGPRHTPRKYRIFDLKSETLVSLRFRDDSQTVGDVRLCGLNRQIRLQLVSTKAGGVIDMHFRDTCSVDEYAWMCQRTSDNTKYANGWVSGYEDTSAALDEAARFLNQNGLAALWYHPGEEHQHQAVVIAYPKGCPQWEFLGVSTANVPPSATLLLAARAPFSSEAFVPPAPGLPSQVQTTHNEPQLGQPMVVDEPESILPFEDATMVDPSAPEPLVNPDNVDIVAVFRDRFGIKYSDLSQVSGEKKDSRRAFAFYLHFPEPASPEYELVKHFLNKYKTIIFDNRAKDDWDKFVQTLTLTCGTILFHQSFVNYQDIPKLSSLLRLRLNVFSISLSEPILHMDSKSHIQRLFPHGGIILVTEDFILRETKRALRVLDWFKVVVERKFPGTWKMFFRPNIQNWMLNLCNEWTDDTMWKLYLKIKEIDPEYPVGHYNSYRRPESPVSLDGLDDDEGQHHPFISTRYLPDYGTRREYDHPDIPKGLTQEERDTDHLVEFFSGWTLMNADKFRKFFVLTSFTPQSRWKKWSHIEVLNYSDFERKLVGQQAKDEQRARLKHHSSSSSRRQSGHAASDSSPATPMGQQRPTLTHSLPTRPPPPPPPSEAE